MLEDEHIILIKLLTFYIKYAILLMYKHSPSGSDLRPEGRTLKYSCFEVKTPDA